MITIKKENYFSDSGGKPFNEDSFAYIPGSTYLVCDGNGGMGKGDVASKIVVKSFLDSFRSDPKSLVDDVLIKTESQITQFLSENPDSDGMSSTLAFAQIRNDGIYIAWVGNSKIYQFRGGELIYLTTDHNWVAEAIKTGVLTEEEAINHPKSNLVTRLIQGTHKSTKADSGLLKDIQRGDIFLLGSAGVSKTWSNEDLVELFKSTTDLDELRAQIVAKCSQRADDNFTGIILQVHDARIPVSDASALAADDLIEHLSPNNPVISLGTNSIKDPEIDKTKIEFLVENETEPKSEENVNNKIKSSFKFNSRYKKYIGYLILVSIIGLLIFKWPKSQQVQTPVSFEDDSISKFNILNAADSNKFLDSSNKLSNKKSSKKNGLDKKSNLISKDTLVKNSIKSNSKYSKYKLRYKKKKYRYNSRYYRGKVKRSTNNKPQTQQLPTPESNPNTSESK